MTLSVQHSDSLFGRVSGFPDGVGEVNAHASENLNSASGWHLPSQRFPLLPLLPRWPLGAGGSDMGMEPSLVLLSGRASHRSFLQWPLSLLCLPLSYLRWLDLLVCPWPRGLGIVHWCWLVHRCQRPVATLIWSLFSALCHQSCLLKTPLFCSISILWEKVWESCRELLSTLNLFFSILPHLCFILSLDTHCYVFFWILWE